MDQIWRLRLRPEEPSDPSTSSVQTSDLMVYSSSQAHRRPRSIKQKKGYCITDLSVVYSLAAAVALKLLLATAADAEADAIDPTLEEKTIHQNSSLARADLDRY